MNFIAESAFATDFITESAFIPREGACVPEKRTFVTDLITDKCIYYGFHHGRSAFGMDFITGE